MKAMIFAAGLGTRLKPYTETMPKALVPVGGVPMLEILIRHLINNNIHDIIINVHHYSEQVIDFLKSKKNFGANIHISDESDYLLDTGGGLNKASWFFDNNEPFLVQNVDIISDLDYSKLFSIQQSRKSLAVLAVCKRTTSRYFLFDDQMQLCGWENIKTGEVKIVRDHSDVLTRFAFSGIHVIDPAVFKLINREGKFSIVDIYLELAANNGILGFEHNAGNWIDMGKPDELVKAENILKSLNSIS